MPADRTRKTAIRAAVRGAVTGVGFRAATVDRARELGALGWVRNAEDEDGVVLVHAEGDPEAVATLQAFLEAGPRGARVEAVEVTAAKVEGHEQFAIRGVSAGAFSVRELADGGFELRLEVEGSDRAWRIPKAPSMDPTDKRLAIERAPGEHAAAAGPIWDRGAYEQGGRVPWPEALTRGHAVFVLRGDRLRGGFALQRTRGRQWLLVKRRDVHAAPRG
ncbi:MAG TPA: acylphosphatase [Baekduia sp.]|nr:acylphosphatase [Baekduia sp.]